jgi:uncharacterized coiled-coil DUF342 family protein
MPDTNPARLVTDDVVTAWYEAFEAAYGVPLAEVERTDSEEVREALEAVARPMVAPVAAERDRLREELRRSEARVASLCEIRDQLQQLRAEERAERDGLAAQVAQVQRARGLLTLGAPDDMESDDHQVSVADIRKALDGEVSS